MSKAKSGVDYDLIGKIETKVFFPELKIKCQYCKFSRAEIDLKRFWCRIQDMMIYNPFAEGLPEFCPVEVTGEVTGKIIGEINNEKKGNK